jgi:hypothetical protein
MEMCFQRHGMSSVIQYRGWVGVRTDLDEYGEEKISHPNRGLNLRPTRL